MEYIKLWCHTYEIRCISLVHIYTHAYICMAETCKLHLLPWNDSILCYLVRLFNFVFIRLSIQHHSYSRDANAKRHTLSCQFVSACGVHRWEMIFVLVCVCAPIFMAKVANNMDLHIKRNCVNCNSFYGWRSDFSPVIYLFYHKYIVSSTHTFISIPFRFVPFIFYCLFAVPFFLVENVFQLNT